MTRTALSLRSALALALGGCSPAGAPDAEDPADLLSETASPEDCLLLVWSSQEKPRAQFDRTHDFVDGGAISCATGTSASQFDAAIAALRAEGLPVSGPHPADALFTPRARQTYDAALAMYHDQALVPLKALDFDEGVNVTLGLPLVRTSPDHGTAFDIAGQRIADPGAMIAALKMAGDMVARRARV